MRHRCLIYINMQDELRTTSSWAILPGVPPADAPELAARGSPMAERRSNLGRTGSDHAQMDRSQGKRVQFEPRSSGV